MPKKYDKGVETIMKILSQFALSSEVYQYAIPKKIGVSYRTVLRVLEELKEWEHIKLVGHEPSKKQGKEQNIWSISLRGLLSFLFYEENSWNDIKRITQIHSDKLLVFKKWSFFEQEKIIPQIKESLILSLTTVLTSQEGLLTLFLKRVRWTEEQLRDYVDSLTLGVYALRMEDKINPLSYQILNSCKKDLELRKFIIEKLNLFKESTQRSLDRIDRNLEQFTKP